MKARSTMEMALLTNLLIDLTVSHVELAHTHLHIHMHKEKENFPSVNAKVKTPNANETTRVNVKWCGVVSHISDTWCIDQSRE